MRAAAMLLMVVVLGGAEKESGIGLQHKTWMVDGVEREALVYVPASGGKGAPVIFAFHGHAGTSRFAARWEYEKLWPEAVVVYPQGLPTKGMTDPEGVKAGWQQRAGDEGDRDLKFFDAMLESLKKDYAIDEKRVFATGHSNGGKMTYLLWETRGKEFAAFAPSAAPGGLGMRRNVPKPLFHIGSPEDPIVKFAWQKASIDAAIKLDGCDETPTKWQEKCNWYASKDGTPVVTLIHHGGHSVPKDGPELIVKFFKEVTAGK
jgi:polyhydroxybutyrate depolymerase